MVNSQRGGWFRGASENARANRFLFPELAGGRLRIEQMKDAKTYRQYAAECRRIAQTMQGEDRATLLQMAELWESTAREADRLEAKKRADKS